MGGQAVLAAQLHVFFSAAGRDVDDAGALGFADLLPGNDRMRYAILCG